MSEIFLIRKKKINDINVHMSSCKVFLSDFNELEFSRQIFEKFSDVKFHENLSSGSRVIPRGQDRRIEEQTR